MLPTVNTVSAAGPGSWIWIDRGQNAFGVGFNVDLDSAANMTFKIEHTFDRIQFDLHPITITRSGTTVTVTFGEAHGLNTNDSLIVSGANIYAIDSNGNRVTSDVFDGTFVVTVSSTTVLTYTCSANAGNTVGNPGGNFCRLRVQPHASITGSTTSVDGNYAFPITGMRINVTAYSAGAARLTVNQGRK